MTGDPPQPRLCHIRKVADFDGYGFNLHAEKNKPGQFVGKIDPGSPAEIAGLKEGDRIVEVNGANVNQENHKQVVTRIKAIENETKLLVVDKTCEEYHKEHGIVVKSSLSYVKICSNDNNTNDEHENVYNDEDDEMIDTRLQKVTIEDVKDEESDLTPTPMINGVSENKISRDNSFSSNKYSDKTSIKEENADEVSTKDVNIEIPLEDDNDDNNSHANVEIEATADDLIDDKIEESATPRSSRSSMSTSPSTSPSPSSDDKFIGLDLPCTAAEMKLRISSKKKKDPRKDNRMDFNRKHQIIQSL